MYVCQRKHTKVKHKRVTKDRLAPNDAARHKYWILAEEAVKFKKALEIEHELKGESASVSKKDGFELMSEGGAFGVGGQVAALGLGAAATLALQDDDEEDEKDKKGKKDKTGAKPNNKKVAATATATGTGDGNGNGNGAEVVVPEQPLAKANKSMKMLAKLSGEAHELRLQMSSVEASETLMANMEKCKIAMETYMHTLHSCISTYIRTYVRTYSTYMQTYIHTCIDTRLYKQTGEAHVRDAAAPEAQTGDQRR